MGCKSLVFDNMEQATPQEVERLLHFVSDQRRTEALKFKHIAGQFACLKSYEMLCQLLTENGMIGSEADLTFTCNPHGKPSLLQFPDIHFNLSHCKSAIAVAVSHSPIGIDVESFRCPTRHLLEYTMNEEEVEAVDKSDCPEITFTELWTKKEALFKYYGTGITHSVRQILEKKPDEIALSTSVNIQKKYAPTICESIS